MNNINKIVDFLFEVGILAKTPRSGFFFLGSGEQSVAEHINRVCYIGFVLGSMCEGVNTGNIIQMCLFHDITEARISDLNYVHQKYTERKELEALKDLAASVPFGNKIEGILKEYAERKSKESLLAKDADNLEFLLSLKEQMDIGNKRAKTWIPSLLERLKTDEAKKIAKVIIDTDSDNWWFGNKNDDWWINRNK